MAEPTFIQVRIDKELKQRATDVLDSIGMDKAIILNKEEIASWNT